jgi:hypothetical protein
MKMDRSRRRRRRRRRRKWITKGQDFVATDRPYIERLLTPNTLFTQRQSFN